MRFEIKCLPKWDQSNFCCCFCPIRTGAITVCWFAVLGNLSMSLRSMAALTLGIPILLEEIPYYGNEIYFTILASSCIGVIIDSLSLYGAYKEESIFMLPQIILEFIGYIIITIAIIIIGIVITIYINFLAALVFLLAAFAVIALCIYLYIIRYSYYRQLEERRKPIKSAP